MAGPDSTDTRPSLQDLREAVADITGVDADTIDDDANLLKLGLDSLAVLRLLNRIRRTGVQISAQDLAVEPNLAAWHKRVLAAPQRSPRR